MMTSDEQNLWYRIQDFELDKPSVVLTFSGRLARENGFSASFSKQVIDEYKKFVFLCCVAKNGATPSHFVDAAWHLHLTYTKSYWHDLCKNTIQKDLHHNPTEGGKSEAKKYKNLYSETLKLYRFYFGINPPTHIWPTANDNFKAQNISIDKLRNWIIRKPNISFGAFNKTAWAVFLSSAMLLVACTGASSGVFIFAVLAVMLLIIVFSSDGSWRRLNQTNNTDSSCGGTTYDHSHSHSDGGDDSSDGGGDGGGDSGCGGGCGGD